MVAVSRAARKTPDLHQPSEKTRTNLFAALESEGLRTHGAPATRRLPIDHPRTTSTFSRIRRTALVAALLLLAVVGERQWVQAPGTNDRQPGPRIARISSQGPAAELRIDAGATVSVPPIALHPGATARPMPAIAATTGHSPSVHVGPDVPIAASDLPRQKTPDTPDSLPEAPNESLPRTLAALGTPSRAMENPIEQEFEKVEEGRHESLGATPFAVSAASGIAYIGRGSAADIANELDLKLSASLGGGHELGIVVGRAPSIEEVHRNRIDTRSRVSSSQSGGPRAVADVAESRTIMLPDYEIDLRNELWMGVAYNYDLQLNDQVRVAPGMEIGGGPAFWRIGIELPTRYRITRSMTVEFVASATRTIPQDSSPKDFANNGIGSAFVYFGQTTATEFTSLGMQLGLRVDLR